MSEGPAWQSSNPVVAELERNSLDPQCPGPDCWMCNGSCCDLCGAGCWNNSARSCDHDSLERHGIVLFERTETSA